MNNKASALLVVMAVMTGFTVLMTSWWQMVGWAGDLALMRQQALTQFYATEAVRNLAVAWVQKSFDQVLLTVTKTQQPITMDGGAVALGAGKTGQFSLVIDKLVGKNQDALVRVTVRMIVDGRVVACHRCLVERENGDRKEFTRFVVRNVFLA